MGKIYLYEARQEGGSPMLLRVVANDAHGRRAAAEHVGARRIVWRDYRDDAGGIGFAAAPGTDADNADVFCVLVERAVDVPAAEPGAILGRTCQGDVIVGRCVHCDKSR